MSGRRHNSCPTICSEQITEHMTQGSETVEQSDEKMLTRASPQREDTNAMSCEGGSNARGRSRQARELPRGTSYVTDEGEVLAREVRRQTLFNRVKGSGNTSRGKGDDYNSTFIAETLRGLYRRAPDKALFVLRERRAGTMTEIGEGRLLPTKGEDIRRRQEHLERGVLEMQGVRSGGRGGLGMVREAFVQEFRDFYEIVGSMEARKWDLCKGDVFGLFEWLKMVDNFLRVYVTVSQRWYVIAGRGDWGIREKKKVIQAGERVEGMKRMMIAMDARCGEMIGRLRRRVEELVETVLRFLEEECGVVGRVLESGFDDMVGRMCREDCGREVVVLLGRGMRDGDWGRKMGGWRAVRRVKERHWDYVGMFVVAEREYRTMYTTLGEEMDGVVATDCVDINKKE